VGGKGGLEVPDFDISTLGRLGFYKTWRPALSGGKGPKEEQHHCESPSLSQRGDKRRGGTAVRKSARRGKGSLTSLGQRKKKGLHLKGALMLAGEEEYINTAIPTDDGNTNKSEKLEGSRRSPLVP